MTTTLDNPSSPEGYQDISVPITEIVTRGSILSVILLLLPVAVYWLIYGFSPFWADVLNGNIVALAIPLLIAGIVAHEVIHAIGWKLFGGLRWRELSFGIDRKSLSPYCHAKVPMRAADYRIGAILPSIITGIIPALIGIAQGNALVTLFGALFISAAVGDFIVLWVIRNVPGTAWVLDHPKNAGCYVKLDS